MFVKKLILLVYFMNYCFTFLLYIMEFDDSL